MARHSDINPLGLVLFLLVSIFMIIFILVAATGGLSSDSAPDFPSTSDTTSSYPNTSTSAVDPAVSTTASETVQFVIEETVQFVIQGSVIVSFNSSLDAQAFITESALESQLQNALLLVLDASSKVYLKLHHSKTRRLAAIGQELWGRSRRRLQQAGQSSVDVSYFVTGLGGVQHLRLRVKRVVLSQWRDIAKNAGGTITKIIEPRSFELSGVADHEAKPELVFGGPAVPILLSLTTGFGAALIYYYIVKRCQGPAEEGTAEASSDAKMKFFKLEALDMLMDIISLSLTYFENDLEFRNDEHNAVFFFLLVLAIASGSLFLLEVTMWSACGSDPFRFCVRRGKSSRKLVLFHFLAEDGCQACIYGLVAASQAENFVKTPALAIALLQSLIFFMYKLSDVVTVDMKIRASYRVDPGASDPKFLT